MATVLVTGGAGYVGSHICKALHRAGHLPIAFDNLSAGRRDAVRWGPFEMGDCCDAGRLHEVFRSRSIDAVMHFAGSAYVDESTQNPAHYYRNNVVGTLTLLQTMLDYGVQQFIFSSSCAVYGDPEVVPLTEEHPLQPISPYGWTKRVTEQILGDFAAAYDLRSVALRYFNAAGADPDGEAGEEHRPETHLIPLLLDAVLGTGDPVPIYGTDYLTPDGTCIRDFVHVVDLAQAHLLALDALRERPGARAYNLGTGRGFSVLEVVQAVERVTGRKVPTRQAPRRPGDPAVLVASAQRARLELGWSPSWQGLDEVVSTAWQWHRRLKRPG